MTPSHQYGMGESSTDFNKTQGTNMMVKTGSNFRATQNSMVENILATDSEKHRRSTVAKNQPQDP
jgi:hypothetical protein